jgi:hypothetical protein
VRHCVHLLLMLLHHQEHQGRASRGQLWQLQRPYTNTDCLRRGMPCPAERGMPCPAETTCEGATHCQTSANLAAVHWALGESLVSRRRVGCMRVEIVLNAATLGQTRECVAMHARALPHHPRRPLQTCMPQVHGEQPTLPPRCACAIIQQPLPRSRRWHAVLLAGRHTLVWVLEC